VKNWFQACSSLCFFKFILYRYGAVSRFTASGEISTVRFNLGGAVQVESS
jgi:hypothetical protein